MDEETAGVEIDNPRMHHREIKLEDGRYMIFYTFDSTEPIGSDDLNDQGEDV